MKVYRILRSKIVHSMALTVLATGMMATGPAYAEGGLVTPQGQRVVPRQGEDNSAPIKPRQDPEHGKKGDRAKKDADMERLRDESSSGYSSGSGAGSGTGSSVGGGATGIGSGGGGGGY